MYVSELHMYHTVPIRLVQLQWWKPCLAQFGPRFEPFRHTLHASPAVLQKPGKYRPCYQAINTDDLIKEWKRILCIEPMRKRLSLRKIAKLLQTIIIIYYLTCFLCLSAGRQYLRCLFRPLPHIWFGSKFAKSFALPSILVFWYTWI